MAFYGVDRDKLRYQIVKDLKIYHEKKSFEFDNEQIFNHQESFKREFIPGRFEKYYINAKNEGFKGGKRSDITEFSRKSRQRLKEYLYRLDYDSCIFATLTIPKNTDYFQVSQDDYKRIINMFKAAVFRRKSWSMVCKLEFQKNCIPHLHIFAFNVVGDLFDFKRSLTLFWVKAVRYVYGNKIPFPVMYNNCSRVDRVRNDLFFFGYISNYTASKKGSKEYQNTFPAGWKNVRFWYKWRMDNVKKKESSICVLSPSNYFQMIKLSLESANYNYFQRSGIIYEKVAQSGTKKNDFKKRSTKRRGSDGIPDV